MKIFESGVGLSSFAVGPEHPTMGGTEHFARDRHFDLEHLKLDLSFDENRGLVRGTSTLTLSPLHDGTTELVLDAVDLDIHSVRAGGKSLRFDAADGEIWIDLGRAYAAGQSLTVAVAYQGTPAKGLYFIKPDRAHPRKPRQIWSQGEMEDNRHWFPGHDAPNDKCTSEVILTVPDKYQAISNGRLVGVRKDRRKRLAVFHWRQDIPHVTYLVSIAIGQFDVVEERFGKIPVAYYVPKGRRRDIRSTFGRTRDIMRFFSEVTGVLYPYDKYAQVVVSDFTFGGMENTSMTILTDRCLVPERLLADTDSDSLIAHELAHQWWGDLVTTKSWTHLWLNEGFASYFAPLYFERARGTDEFHFRMKDSSEAYFSEARIYQRSIVTHRWHVSEDMFDSHTYQKGAWVLHMLRGCLGDDLFWKGIRRYIAKHARQIVETADLKIAFEEATGRNLDAFFEQWLHRGGHPEYEVSTEWDETASVLKLSVKQIQKTDETTPLFRMPVEIVVSVGSVDKTFRVTIEKAHEVFAFPLPARPRAVYFDPRGWVLKTVKFFRGVQTLLHELQHGPTALARSEAAELLGKEPRSEKILAALEAALEWDPFYGVRQAAAESLGALGGSESARILVRGLRQKNPKVRRSVAAALGKVKPEWSERPLLAALQRDRSDLVRAAAAGALGKAKAKRAFSALVAAARRKSWNDVLRAGVAGALGDLAEERGIALCQRFSAYGNALSTRSNAVDSLVKLWKRFPDRREEIAEHLVDFVKDREYLLRRRAVESCAGVDIPPVREALQGALEKDIMLLVRRTARLALAKMDRARGGAERIESLSADMESLKETLKECCAKISALEARVRPSGPRRK